ncbi:SusD/RagB family nutrient-binding outer membrane lipoprotein [Marinifilum sp.]|uniref:SusD/RagB family nutrient-binding outer membrane lipoprotein n=1 Tax=Marinifilum sp. TaxID=2033137 RepID=UPI003BAB2BEE
MRIIKNIGIALIALLSLSGCDSWLDINQSPNSVNEVEPQFLFGYAITSWSGNRTGGDSYLPIELMNQTAASGGSFGWGYAEDRYDISPYSTGNAWKMYYATSGANLKEAIKIAEENGDSNIAAQCKIAFASMFYECTMIWGDVPFEQAWTEENYPKFDTQESILNNLIAMLDEAINQIDESNNIKITLEDAFFSGDLNKWKKLANSMKYKIAMVMVDADPTKADLIAQLVKEDLLTSSDNVEFPYYDESGHKNPKYRLFEKYNGGQNTWIFANTIILDDMMKPLDDPRIPIYFAPGKEAVVGDDYYKGVETATEADDTHSLIRVGTILRADAPDLILSSHEIKFLIAETYARGLGMSANLVEADKYFKEGLQEALSYYGVDQSDIDTFVAKPELDLKSVTNPLNVLRVQQYVDLQDRPLEAWVQMRRSGAKGSEIPNLSTPNGADAPDGEIARRWDYPNNELSGNKNGPKVLPKMWESMWFDK